MHDSPIIISNIILSDIILSDIILSDIILSDIILSDIILSDIILSDIILSESAENYIIPPIPAPAGIAGVSSLIFATTDSVVRSVEATEVAF